MSLPPNGMEKTALLDMVESLKERDLPWKSGRVLAYTYDPGDEIADVVKQAYLSIVNINNIGIKKDIP